jgi:hypothetical protein
LSTGIFARRTTLRLNPPCPSFPTTTYRLGFLAESPPSDIQDFHLSVKTQLDPTHSVGSGQPSIVDQNNNILPMHLINWDDTTGDFDCIIMTDLSSEENNYFQIVYGRP